jgi:glycosyltransferase involved in cell wall biosynthesis
VPLVSVLLAVHDDDRFVRLAVESVLRQTLTDLELIVIDDASTDDTPALLSTVADRRLVPIANEEQLGLAASLNRGLDRASGRYIARLDADDLALPERLDLQVAHIGSASELAVVGSAVLDLDEHGRTGRLHRNPFGPRGVRWLALFSSPFFHPTVLVDREALEERELRYDTGFLESEDYELWSRLLENAEGANLAEPLVLKRVHPRQASLRRSDLQISFQRQVALREIARVAPDLSTAEAECAWAFGSGRAGREGADAYLAVLEAFERRYGADSEVRGLAARSLGRFPPRPVLRSVRRRVDERGARRRAQAWLGSLADQSGTVRVAVVSPEPTPYRSPLFDRVAARSEVDLTVIYAATTVAGRTWSVQPHHRAVFLGGLRAPGLRRLLRHDYPVTPGIGRALRRARPDVVVVSGWSTFASQAAIAWSRARRVPFALLVESHDLGPRATWRRRVKRTVVPRLVRGAASFLAVGSLARDSLVSHGAPAERVRVFANTVDLDLWEERAGRLAARRPELRAELGAGEEDVVVLSVGRLTAEKGFDALVRAAAAVADRRLILAIAGSGPEEAALKELAGELGVRLHLLGDLPESRVAEAYVAGDVFALLSLHETWGVVVNEAAASGLPLVLSDRVGAASDLLRDGENGFLVPAAHVDAAAEALSKLASDEELRRALGDRSRELVAGWGYEPSIENFVAAVREATAR